MTTTLDNHGERLVPGRSHDLEETVRHKSSYRFFRAIIEADNVNRHKRPIRILDLGCGVGHGSLMLSEVEGSEIVGIDASAQAIAYAKEKYAAKNITYLAESAEKYQIQAPAFDYVVSRHALEHIPNGLSLALKFSYNNRMIVNVPYHEPALTMQDEVVNPHHELNNISEDDFDEYPNREFFYEDLEGLTTRFPQDANSIICVTSTSRMKKVGNLIQFPFDSWRPNELENLGLRFYETMDKIKNDAAHEFNQLQDRYNTIRSEYEGLRNRRSVKIALKIIEIVRKMSPKP